MSEEKSESQKGAEAFQKGLSGWGAPGLSASSNEWAHYQAGQYQRNANEAAGGSPSGDDEIMMFGGLGMAMLSPIVICTFTAAPVVSLFAAAASGIVSATIVAPSLRLMQGKGGELSELGFGEAAVGMVLFAGSTAIVSSLGGDLGTVGLWGLTIAGGVIEKAHKVTLDRTKSEGWAKAAAIITGIPSISAAILGIYAGYQYLSQHSAMGWRPLSTPLACHLITATRFLANHYPTETVAVTLGLVTACAAFKPMKSLFKRSKVKGVAASLALSVASMWGIGALTIIFDIPSAVRTSSQWIQKNYGAIPKATP